jgi:hypothetical protein
MNVIRTGQRSLVWALLFLTTLGMTTGAPVYAQNGNLLKWIFWQNQQTKKELTELKKEVRGPAFTSTSESPLVTIFAVLFSVVLVAAALWFLRRSSRQSDLFGEMHRVNSGQFQQAWEARCRNVLMHYFAPLFALSLCGLVAILPNVDQSQLNQMQTLLLVGVLSLPLLASGVVPLVAVARMTQEKYRPRYDLLKANLALHGLNWCIENYPRILRSAEAVTQTDKPSLLSSEAQCADRWFLHFPDGKIKGPGEGENIRVLAKQGKYPPGTTWSQQANGPWVPVPGVKAAAAPPPAPAAPAVQWWIRTPDGRQSGPHTKEQLAKSASAGRLPQGTVVANSPNGPWKRIQLRKQT